VSGRWLQLLAQLWPAEAVWLLIALPTLAFYSPQWSTEVRAELPWWFRAFQWCVVHTWPYTKVARAGVRFGRWDQELRAQRFVASCAVCRQIPAKVLELDHMLDHFPGEDEAWDAQWWTPPSFQTPEEADRWLAARQTTGADYWE
jgi:hypothetical protein